MEEALDCDLSTENEIENHNVKTSWLTSGLYLILQEYGAIGVYFVVSYAISVMNESMASSTRNQQDSYEN
jgi:hypothetical protein